MVVNNLSTDLLVERYVLYASISVTIILYNKLKSFCRMIVVLAFLLGWQFSTLSLKKKAVKKTKYKSTLTTYQVVCKSA